MRNDAIISIFDERKGPVILYSSLGDLDVAKKVAVRSYVAIGAMEEAQDLSGRHAVVPLPSLNKIAFYYMFRVNREIPDSNNALSCWGTIGYMSESVSSIDFYRSIPNVQEDIQKIVELIEKDFIYTERENKLSENIIRNLNSLLALVQEEKEVVVEPSPEIRFDDFKRADLAFLFDYFPEDLDKVIYSLLLEQPLLIIGDIKDLIQKVVVTLEFLIPHRLLKKEYLITYVDPKGEDILICPSRIKFLKKYRNITNINITNRQISSKVKSVPSITNLIQTLRVAPGETQQSVIKTYINEILAKTAELMELCEKEQIDREEIHIFRTNLKADELNIVIAMVRKFAPHFENKLFYFARSMI